jgi:hypothetical protein
MTEHQKMDSLVRFLFGHEQAVFTNGRFGFDVRPGALLLILIFLLAAAFIYFIYLRPRVRLPKRTTATLIALRATLLTVMILLLLRPVVVVSSVIPRSSYVALLVDDSLSMNLHDGGNGATRLDTVKQALLNTGPNTFLNRLEQKFKTSLYGFSGALSRLKDGNDLDGEGRTSDLSGALDETIKRSSGMPLSAIVLATDGAANVPSDITNTLRELRARDIAVFTVGVGDTAKPLDAELTRINMPRRVLVGSRVNIETFVGLSGYGATKVLLGVREDGRAIKTEEFNLRGNDTEAINLEITPTTPGVHRYTVEITPLDGEITVDNNKQDALVEVIQGPLRLLHVEGEPRWELGKIREALQLNEKNIVLVSLQRTGENKFYRQGIGNQVELSTGFPKTEEELFSYDGLVIGSVEAGFFSADQLRSIEAFVARRGGGLLALGGRLSFDGGKYKGTALDDLLPLSLTGGTSRRGELLRAGLQAILNRRGPVAPDHAFERRPRREPKDLERTPADFSVGSVDERETRRDGPARSAQSRWLRRARAVARATTIRARTNVGPHRIRHLALAHENGCKKQLARNFLAADAALCCERHAAADRSQHGERRLFDGRHREHRRRRARQEVQRGRRRARDSARDEAVGCDC